jgi:hypothetical protein
MVGKRKEDVLFTMVASDSFLAQTQTSRCPVEENRADFTRFAAGRQPGEFVPAGAPTSTGCMTREPAGRRRGWLQRSRVSRNPPRASARRRERWVLDVGTGSQVGYTPVRNQPIGRSRCRPELI